MALVQLSDVIVPEYFAEYMANNSMVSAALFQRGVMVGNPGIIPPKSNGIPGEDTVMLCLGSPLRLSAFLSILLAAALLAPLSHAQVAPSAGAPPTEQVPPPPPDATAPPPGNMQSPQAHPPQPAWTVPPFDKALFQDPIPPSYLGFLAQYDGAPAGALYHDKQFRVILKYNVPDCMFHYGRDMPLRDALDMVFPGSTAPVQIRDNRYVFVASHRGPYLAGTAFLWIDMQSGIFLGAFYFHPTNGEPTPTVAVFSRQVRIRDKSLDISQLPPAFVEDLAAWSSASYIPPLTTRYFLTGLNKRILLEHNEDFCAVDTAPNGAPPPPPDACEQMNADAADLDLNTAYYLQQVNYATNATAWMINGPDQVAWVELRDNTCRAGPDPLGCRIRMTRQRTHIIVMR